MKRAAIADGKPAHWRSTALALFCGLLLRLPFVYALPNVQGDTLVYGTFAKNLLLHGVYGYAIVSHGVVHYSPTLVRLPGYPLFLALCFRLFGVEQYTPVMLVQTAIDLWTCLLVAGLAARLFGRQTFAPALWLAALCPFTANYVASPLTETPTLFTVALAFYALTRWRGAGAGVNRWLFGVAFALALSIQLRPDQGLMAAAVVPAMLLMSYAAAAHVLYAAVRLRTAVVPAVLVSLLTLAPLVPWAARNWRDFHIFQPLAPKEANDPGESVPYGFQRWYRTFGVDFFSTELTYWPYDGAPIAINDLPDRAFDNQAQYDATAALLAAYDEDSTPTPAFDRRFAAIAGERIRAHPLRYYVLLPLARLVNMLFRPRGDALPLPLDWWVFAQHPWMSLLASAYGLLNLGYFALAAFALGRRRTTGAGNGTVVGAILAWCALRCLLLLTIDNSEPRYTLEFFPVLIALGAGCWAQSRMRRDPGSLPPGLA